MIKVPLLLRDLLKRDGSRILTSDWDIGNGRMIQADKIRARNGDGLALYEDGGAGIFVKDGGKVGIGTVTPDTLLHLYGASARLHLQDDENSDSYFQIADTSMPDALINKYSNTGHSLIALNPKPLDGTSSSSIRFFRDTNTTGTKKIICYKGNSTTTIHALIGVDGQNSYFQNGGGKLGIGTSAPDDVLDVLATPNFQTLRLTNTKTNSVIQRVGLVSQHYTAAEEPLSLISGYNNGSGNIIFVGGGGASQNAATELRFYTGANSTTLEGSIRMSILSNGKVGIGTTSPQELLHLEHSDDGERIRIMTKDSTTGKYTGAIFKVSSSDADGYYKGGILFERTGSSGVGKLHLAVNGAGDDGNIALSDACLTIDKDGNVGIGTTAPGNPLAVNRSADGIIVDFESADTVEGNVSIAGNTTSYNAFMGSHYTQLKDGQAIPPVGSVVIATGEIIHCEANIEVPVMERYYEEEIETAVKDSIEDDIIEEEVDTGRKQNAYIFINGKIIETEIPVLETVTKVKGKKLKEYCHLDEKNGKVYEKIDKILKVDEEAPEHVTVLERQKLKDGNPLTEIKTKEVSGVERKEYFSYIELASQKADKRVYGVYHAKLSDNAKGQSFGEDTKAVHQIAALGLYKVRVTDTNGDIAAGDYIQSSIRLGEGEKQGDDILHNYTIGKAIIDVNFSDIKLDSELGYKWRLIPVTLHCG